MDEGNALIDQTDAKLTELDSLSSQGALLKSEVDSMKDDAEDAKSALGSNCSEYDKRVRSINLKRKELSIFSFGFDEILGSITSRLKKLKGDSAKTGVKSLNEETDACDLKVAELNANTERRKALHDEITVKQARISDIYSSIMQMWP